MNSSITGAPARFHGTPIAAAFTGDSTPAHVLTGRQRQNNRPKLVKTTGHHRPPAHCVRR
jgi:hypothetical protein